MQGCMGKNNVRDVGHLEVARERGIRRFQTSLHIPESQDMSRNMVRSRLAGSESVDGGRGTPFDTSSFGRSKKELESRFD